jgi:hypothetical protein
MWCFWPHWSVRPPRRGWNRQDFRPSSGVICLAFVPSSFRWVVAGELARLLAAGARHADIGQKGDEGWQVLADAE